jgi:hypothetical protein
MMYQVVPLLLALALLMPWTSPADPGNRVAAANAADGLTEQALIYHQAALAYVALNPGIAGAVSSGALPTGWNAPTIASCTKSGMVATYIGVPTTVSGSAVASAMGRLWGGYPLVGQAQSNRLTNPFTGASTVLPCAIPNGAPVIFSQAGG